MRLAKKRASVWSMPTRCTARLNHSANRRATNRPIRKIAAAARTLPLQVSSVSPINCGFNHFEIVAARSSMRGIVGESRNGDKQGQRAWDFRPPRPAPERATRPDRSANAWGILAAMKRLSIWLPLLIPVVALAGCATLPKTGGGDAQIDVDSHTLLGEIAFERQQVDTAAQEFLG